MEPNERERFTDELLDAALRQYGSVEPRAGLEQRVLAGVRAGENEATARWWRWQWVTVAVAAVLMIALGVYLAVPRENAARPPEIANKPAMPQPGNIAPAMPPEPVPAAPVPPREVAEAPKALPRRAVVAAVIVAPAHTKRDVFPAPAPISEQERVALHYAQRAPQEALLAAAAKANQPPTSLHIEEIQVAPLAEPQGTEENPQDGIQK
jgi:hypothetical protein